jgi:ATP/maltotriose-dependent transcriptional regulator MalT
LAETFVGRQAELRLLRRMLGEARAGRPQVVLIEGPGGIGKTALVDRFIRYESDVRLLRASGERWGALVAYGVVDQLLRVAGVRATPVLLAREQALPAEEPVSVGAGILELLGDRSEDLPVLLVVDDAHWADVDSLRALLFALRRLVADRV